MKKIGKDVVFKIKKEDIKNFYIKRAKRNDYFSFVLDAVLNEGQMQKTHGTHFSVIFERCDINKNTTKTTKKLTLNTAPNLCENCDTMSFAKCIKLCKKIGITPTFV